MTCTRCGGDLQVVQTMQPAGCSPAKRRAAKRLIGDVPIYVVRRRRCMACEHIVYTVEVEISAPAPSP